MSLHNDIRFEGYCGNTPELKQTKKGVDRAILVVYTHDRIGNQQYIDQSHRCVFFGDLARKIIETAEQGRHITVRGEVRYFGRGKGASVGYYTNYIINEFKLSPRQNVQALQGVVRGSAAR